MGKKIGMRVKEVQWFGSVSALLSEMTEISDCVSFVGRRERQRGGREREGERERNREGEREEVIPALTGFAASEMRENQPKTHTGSRALGLKSTSNDNIWQMEEYFSCYKRELYWE